jgi:hypothetical protein
MNRAGTGNLDEHRETNVHGNIFTEQENKNTLELHNRPRTRRGRGLLEDVGTTNSADY